MKRKWNRIAVLGCGHVGSTVADMLDDAGFEVSVFDIEKDETGKGIGTDLTDPAQIASALVRQDAVISCLPFSLNKQVAQTAKDSAVHYFDLTEDVETTAAIRKMAGPRGPVFMPQCGLAPGFIGILGMDAHKKDPRRSGEPEGYTFLELRVGALPGRPRGKLGYACTWSPEGVINEYIKPCTVIENWEKVTIPPFYGLERLQMRGWNLEAFNTSGGLGTLCETLLGKVKWLDYKTIRYPGHFEAMSTLLQDFGLQYEPKLAAEVLRGACPATDDDRVFVRVRSRIGITFDSMYEPRLLYGKKRTAIAWTTAAGACAVVELVANGTLPGSGFIKQEQVWLSDFFATKSGGLLT